MAPTVLTSAALEESLLSRFPNLNEQGGVIADMHAAASTAPEPTSSVLPAMEAASVIGFADTETRLVWLRTQEHIYVKGTLATTGSYIQIPDNEAKRRVNAGQAVYVTDEEVAKAQKAGK